jgi:GNAT superfamily N-acetyltransferase
MSGFSTSMAGAHALIRSAVRNHTSWMTVRGEAVHAHGELSWVLGRANSEASVPFPTRVTGEAADAMLADCRAARQCGIGCWTSGLEPIGELAAVLVARGFEWGWQAHWMAFALDALPEIEDARVSVARDPLPDTWRATASGGQAVVHLAGEDAGIYDVQVESAHRGTGLGRALTVAALRRAIQAGARTATVNATEEGTGLYSSLGARSLGHGQTFWIHRDGLSAHPSPALVAAAEAAGRGRPPDQVPDARLPGNGLGLAHVAFHAGHRDRAAWLLEHGAAADPLIVYELGGADALAGYRGSIDERLAPYGHTVLHEAVQRRDMTLLRAALELGADDTARDARFRATPLDWARHLGNAEAAELLTR